MIQKMKKSKGFTLIEMLVVIAIIAVLVSIVVPVVGNSTAKARAAADAANLRTVAASASIAIMESADVTSPTIENSDLPSNGAITNKSAFGGTLAIYVINNEVVPAFGTFTIDDYVAVAEGATAPAATATGSLPSGYTAVWTYSAN